MAQMFLGFFCAVLAQLGPSLGLCGDVKNMLVVWCGAVSGCACGTGSFSPYSVQYYSRVLGMSLALDGLFAIGLVNP